MTELLGMPTEAAVGLISGFGGFLMKNAAQKAADQQKMMELAILKQNANRESADAAANRGSPFLRKFAAIVVLLVAFVGLYIVAFFPSIPVTILQESPSRSFFGVFEWGGGLKATVAQGLVIPEWFKYSVISIIHFLFGTGAAKVSR